MPIPKRPYSKRGEMIQGYTIKHHPLYSTYYGMLVRCYCEDEPGYENYGGRGITVCDEWLHSFKSFAEYMGFKPTSKHTLDRIDNDKGYEPDNVRWATRTEQCLNRRTFKNNSTGVRGVVPRCNGRFYAKFCYEGREYILGTYASAEEAGARYDEFSKLFLADKEKALRTIKDTLWCTSSTGMRGINKSGNYFTANCTINKVQHYIGCFSTKEEAYEARQRFITERTS